MIKNKRKYFNKNSASNLNLSNNKSRDSEVLQKYGTASTAEARAAQNYAKNTLSYNEQDSTSINDSDHESGVKMSKKLSHHARIKDKLKLLKSNLRNNS